MRFPEHYRWRNAPKGYATKPGDQFGAFVIPANRAKGRMLRIIANSGTADGSDLGGLSTGWDHASVSVGDGPNAPTPTWEEMCLVKSMFWEANDCVVQFHPPEADYVNVHSGCLHLWCRVEAPFPMPPKVCV